MSYQKIRSWQFLVFCGVLTLMLGACAKKQTVKKTAVPETQAALSEDGVNSEELDIHGKDFESSKELKEVRFNYDQFELSEEARDVLAQNAEYLKKNAEIQVLAAGHCDQRGTIGYNLALGQRRAAIVREYYVNLGIEPKRIGSISYGKEKPACAQDNEPCWSQNRRVETKVRSTKMADGPNSDPASKNRE